MKSLKALLPIIGLSFFILACGSSKGGGNDVSNNDCEVPEMTTAFSLNQSTATLCAEEDNVNIPILSNVDSFIIEATHPAYIVGTDNCAPDFANCPPAVPGYPFIPGVFELFNDGETIVEAIRESEWWLPNGIDFSVDNNDPENDIHYIRIYRKIADANEWPQFFVLYMDGNVRLIPHPPVGTDSVCFGSSVIIGPAPIAERPMAEIASARYISASGTVEILYQAGGTATLEFLEINRTIARVMITVNYTTKIPFATFRSMFVEDGNSDVDHVIWKNTSGNFNDEPIMTFLGGEGIEWLFFRRTRSQHNTSSPDIRIKLE